MSEKEPWIWLNDGEAVGKADCGCELHRDYKGMGPAVFVCAFHRVPAGTGGQVEFESRSRSIRTGIYTSEVTQVSATRSITRKVQCRGPR